MGLKDVFQSIFAKRLPNVPPGKFTKALACYSNRDLFLEARNAINALVNDGDRSGLDELEALIRANDGGAHVTFHKPTSYEYSIPSQLTLPDLQVPGLTGFCAAISMKLDEGVAVARMTASIQETFAGLETLYQNQFVSDVKKRVERKAGPQAAHYIELICLQVELYGRFMRQQTTTPAVSKNEPSATEQTQGPFEAEPARCCKSCGYVETYGDLVQARHANGATDGEIPPGAAIECCQCMKPTELKWKLPDGAFVDRVAIE